MMKKVIVSLLFCGRFDGGGIVGFLEGLRDLGRLLGLTHLHGHSFIELFVITNLSSFFWIGVYSCS